MHEVSKVPCSIAASAWLKRYYQPLGSLQARGRWKFPLVFPLLARYCEAMVRLQREIR
ncbi:hypothetical protein ACAG16_02790 [Escherichia coli]